MKRIACLILAAAVGLCGVNAAETALPEGFPATPATNAQELAEGFSFHPYTVARFEMKRELPTGRTLESRGTFEFCKGIGIMWLTEHPVVNAMIISPNSIALYDANARLLRSNDFSKSPAGRQMSSYINGATADSFSQMSRAFTLTYARNGEELQLGMVPRRKIESFEWMWVHARKGVLESVQYSAGARGRTTVRFSDVRDSEQIPEKPFKIRIQRR